MSRNQYFNSLIMLLKGNDVGVSILTLNDAYNFISDVRKGGDFLKSLELMS